MRSRYARTSTGSRTCATSIARFLEVTRDSRQTRGGDALGAKRCAVEQVLCGTLFGAFRPASLLGLRALLSIAVQRELPRGLRQGEHLPGLVDEQPIEGAGHLFLQPDPSRGPNCGRLLRRSGRRPACAGLVPARRALALPGSPMHATRRQAIARRPTTSSSGWRINLRLPGVTRSVRGLARARRFCARYAVWASQRLHWRVPRHPAGPGTWPGLSKRPH